MLSFLKSLASVYDFKTKLDIQVVSSTSITFLSILFKLKYAEMILYLWSLVSLLQRLFVVPASPEQKEIPFARVNHNKYMVTDKVAYIGKAAHTLHVKCKKTHILDSR